MFQTVFSSNSPSPNHSACDPSVKSKRLILRQVNHHYSWLWWKRGKFHWTWGGGGKPHSGTLNPREPQWGSQGFMLRRTQKLNARDISMHVMSHIPKKRNVDILGKHSAWLPCINHSNGNTQQRNLMSVSLRLKNKDQSDPWTQTKQQAQANQPVHNIYDSIPLWVRSRLSKRVRNTTSFAIKSSI